MPVKSLGLIHAGSMQNLISESVAHVYKKDLGSSNPQNLEGVVLGVAEESMDRNENINLAQTSETLNLEVAEEPINLDKDVNPADMQVVKSIRSSIIDVLGDDLSPSDHPAPKIPVSGVAPIMYWPSLGLRKTRDRESLQETKRVRTR